MVNTELENKKLIKSNKRIKRIKIAIGIMIIFILSIFMPYPFLYMANYGNGFNNSIYSTDFYKNKNVMVIVPHQDDEINVAGATIKNYINGGSDVIVVFTTNGDYYGLGKVRIDEAINAMEKLGVRSENVVFLGYGDKWDTEYNHIYHAPDNEIVKSYIGNIETYGNESVETFKEIMDSGQSSYTRDNYKNDIKNVILHYLPDTILAVDFDSHVDHRATSLLFEEAMGEILREYEEYEPNIFKGFAYNTAWNAVDDFYGVNLESTVAPDKSNIINDDYELDVPNYDWNNRVRFPVPKEMLSYTKRSNLIYEALSEHKSQNANLNTIRIVNSDQVFWKRDTSSVTYNADIEVSSGEKSYLNDFKLVDSSDITERNAKFDKCIWIPEEHDTDKYVNVILESPSDIYSVSLYDNFGLDDNILKGILTFSDGSEIIVENLNKNGSETTINFPVKNNIEYVTFKIVEYEGSEPGLCELEIFDKVKDVDIQYIKLMVDNEEETFMYRYTVLNEREIPLNIYSYPNTNSKITLDDCKISVIKGNEYLNVENNSLNISDDIKPGKYKVRVELRNNPMIFDEVEIVIPNVFEKIWLKLLTTYEQFFDRVCLSLRYRLGLLE